MLYSDEGEIIYPCLLPVNTPDGKYFQPNQRVCIKITEFLNIHFAMALTEHKPLAKPDSAFSLSNEAGYQAWRQAKLAGYPTDVNGLIVPIQNPARLTDDEYAAILAALERANLAIYRCAKPLPDKDTLRLLGQQFGLQHLDANLCADDDSITSLTAIETGRHSGYIPYTNKQLSWHTDGYYNPMDQQIRAIVMHCASPALHGGENQYLDHEMLYLQLRDTNPDYIAALMRDDAMSIPPNVEDGEEIRGETVGPVFSVDEDGHLHMRYSARKRNIKWRDDAATQAATNLITELLASSPYVLRYKLQAHEGVITNNALHNRSAFEDDATHKRLLYRARYFDRAINTRS